MHGAVGLVAADKCRRHDVKARGRRHTRAATSSTRASPAQVREER